MKTLAILLTLTTMAFGQIETKTFKVEKRMNNGIVLLEQKRMVSSGVYNPMNQYNNSSLASIGGRTTPNPSAGYFNTGNRYVVAHDPTNRPFQKDRVFTMQYQIVKTVADDQGKNVPIVRAVKYLKK